MQSAPKHSQTLIGGWLNKFSILLHYTYYMQAKDIATYIHTGQQQPMEYKKRKNGPQGKDKTMAPRKVLHYKARPLLSPQLVYI